MTTKDSLTTLWKKQVMSIVALGSALDMLTAAVDGSVAALGASDTGRIIYVGAGTPERIGIQDGAELLPTFGFPTERVVFMGAAGMRGLRRAIEGAEDLSQNAVKRLTKLKLTPHDVVVCIASSGTTPYVVAACEFARNAGAVTIGISSNPHSPLLQNAQFPVLTETGAEPIAGSTRMNAGTGQSATLKMWSTAVMIKMGRTFGNLMVCMIPLNDKLRIRARDMIVAVHQKFDHVCTPARAKRALEQAKEILGPRETDKNIRLAIVIAGGQNPQDAHRILEQHNYHLRPAMASLGFKEISPDQRTNPTLKL